MADRKGNSNVFSLSPSSSSSSPAAPAIKETRPAARSSLDGESAKITKRVEWMQEDIDASAEEFIKSFKKNLLLQRLQSFENYKDMLARGV
ncbi:hypothetical protein IEQ34_006545 [Dendrobium chrysotoxum]|uniref:Uncharacterized protein n=1 Tax=Dendrobium chrysotoxum TaxID=161865 RepID=A0AAV7H7Z2_DENCH|nr:hypothetical protein IEQ34_006545 [Dendrobium chrysotoxum]